MYVLLQSRWTPTEDCCYAQLHTVWYMHLVYNEFLFFWSLREKAISYHVQNSDSFIVSDRLCKKINLKQK